MAEYKRRDTPKYKVGDKVDVDNGEYLWNDDMFEAVICSNPNN